MRLLKIALVATVLLLGGGVAYIWWHFQSCLGSMSQCYRAWHATANNTSPLDRRRATSLYGGLTASATAIAFQVPVSAEVDGLIIIDRSSRQARLMTSPDTTYWSPHFSDDGEHIVFGRSRIGHRKRELVECRVNTWNCTIALETTEALMFPMYISENRILLALGRPVTRVIDGKERHSTRYDFYAISAGQPPTRLTHLDLLSVSSLSFGSGQLYYGAPNLPAVTHRPGCESSIKCDRSEIFRLDLDSSALANKSRASSAASELAFIVDGFSVRPTISSDATRIAFLNTSLEKFTFRWDLAVLNGNGAALETNPLAGKTVTLKKVVLDGIAFSSGVFVGPSLLVNELFSHHYRIREFDSQLRETSAIEIDHSATVLAKLPRIELTASY